MDHNTFEALAIKLAKDNPEIAGYFNDIQSDIFQPISQPIDKGAKDLLSEYRNAYLTYPPLEVDYLIQTLNEHISNCLDLRIKAQELEIKAFTEITDQLFNQFLLSSVEAQVKLSADSEPKMLGNTINAHIVDGTIAGDKNSTYWKDMLEQQKIQLKSKKDNSQYRLNKMSEPGSGLNYVERFSALKEIFNKDLVEAYCRARTAVLGLKHVYNIDIQFPELTDIGYLDKLTLWSREATYALEKKYFNLRITNVVFSLREEILPSKAYYDQRKTGNIKFKLENHHFQQANMRLKNVRLRGVDLQFITKNLPPPSTLSIFRAKIQMPNQIIPMPVGIPSFQYLPIVYNAITTVNYGIDNTVKEIEQIREVYNIDPIGQWEISFDDKDLNKAISATEIGLNDNIYVRMKIQYER